MISFTRWVEVSPPELEAITIHAVERHDPYRHYLPWKPTGSLWVFVYLFVNAALTSQHGATPYESGHSWWYAPRTCAWILVLVGGTIAYLEIRKGSAVGCAAVEQYPYDTLPGLLPWTWASILPSTPLSPNISNRHNRPQVNQPPCSQKHPKRLEAKDVRSF